MFLIVKSEKDEIFEQNYSFLGAWKQLILQLSFIIFFFFFFYSIDDL